MHMNVKYPLSPWNRLCNFLFVLNFSTKCLEEKISITPIVSVSIFNSIIRASLLKGSPRKTLNNYKVMLEYGWKPDQKTLIYVLESCKLVMNFSLAREIHCRSVKTGLIFFPHLSSILLSTYMAFDFLEEARVLFDEISKRGFDLVSANLLIAGYLKAGELHVAKKMFAEMPKRDVVSWNTIISGCVQNMRPKMAIRFFDKMVDSGMEPDRFTFASILSACARMGALDRGERVRDLMIKTDIELNCILCSALIDMYSKCGRISDAIQIFNSAKRHEISVWNSMITAFAVHGLGTESLKTFSRMESEGIQPDSVTFLSILTGCSHCGLINEGRRTFYSMREKHTIEPQLEHYGAMVDMFSRAGLLEEANRMIQSMPMEPDPAIWRSLLSACRIYKRPDLGESVMEKVVRHGSGDYVLLSNMYSSIQKWSCAERVRELMKRKKIRKQCGLSWVEFNGVVHEFKSGDRSHPESDSIYRLLEKTIQKIRNEGHVSSMDLVLMDVLEEEKEGNLNCHSEKLGVAFAFLKTGPRSEIRVSKNLRTCLDCHDWIKMFSKVFSRVITMRDRVRFHRFENGTCSCGDYW